MSLLKIHINPRQLIYASYKYEVERWKNMQINLSTEQHLIEA